MGSYTAAAAAAAAAATTATTTTTTTTTTIYSVVTKIYKCQNKDITKTAPELFISVIPSEKIT